MNRPSLFRSLRIAWSVWWGMLCVLLVVMWVRSYWWVDAISIAPSHYLGSMQGWFCLDCDYTYPLEVRPSSHRFGPFKVLSIWNRDEKVMQWVQLVAIPIWPPILLIAGVVAAPWLPWRISWSVAWVLVALGLVANGIAMYDDSWRHELRMTSTKVLTIEGHRGRAALAIWDLPRGGPDPTSVLWQIHRGPEADHSSGVPLGFRFLGRAIGSGMAVVIPYWFLILMSLAAAVASWLHWRFSLRTLLFGMTLMAVALGVIAASM